MTVRFETVQMFQTFMHDEAALLRAARAEWALVPLSYSARGTEPTEEPAVLVGQAGVTVGRNADNQVVCDSPTVRRAASGPKPTLVCAWPACSHRLSGRACLPPELALVGCCGEQFPAK